MRWPDGIAPTDATPSRPWRGRSFPARPTFPSGPRTEDLRALPTGRLKIADRRVVSRETPLMGPADFERADAPSSRPGAARASPRPAFPGPAPMDWAAHGVALAERRDVWFAWTHLCCLIIRRRRAFPPTATRTVQWSQGGGGFARAGFARTECVNPLTVYDCRGARMVARGKSEPHVAGIPTQTLLTSPAPRSTPGDPGGVLPEPLPPPVPGCGLQPCRCVARPGASHAESDDAVRAGARRPDLPMFHVKRPATARERETPRCPARPRTGEPRRRRVLAGGLHRIVHRRPTSADGARQRHRDAVGHRATTGSAAARR